MKKIISILLSLMMLCSIMVVNVSASNVYSEEGFEITTDHVCILECDISEFGFAQYTLMSSDLSGMVTITTEKWFDEPYNLYNENHDNYPLEETLTNGNFFGYTEGYDGTNYEYGAHSYSDYYYYTFTVTTDDWDSYYDRISIINEITFNYDEVKNYK